MDMILKMIEAWASVDKVSAVILVVIIGFLVVGFALVKGEG